jgi:hypothetical protein
MTTADVSVELQRLFAWRMMTPNDWFPEELKGKSDSI